MDVTSVGCGKFGSICQMFVFSISLHEHNLYVHSVGKLQTDCVYVCIQLSVWLCAHVGVSVFFNHR